MSRKNPSNSTKADYEQQSGENRQTAPDDFESFQEFQAIISLARSADKLAPPGDIVQRVISRIGAAELKQCDRALWNRLIAGLESLTVPSSGKEMALCYFLAGFFYLVVAGISFVGLNSIQPHGSYSYWLKLQPYIALASAGGLTLLGYILIKNESNAARYATTGTVGFLLFHTINGICLHARSPNLAQLPVQIGFVAGSVALGLFLITAMSRYRRLLPGASAAGINGV